MHLPHKELLEVDVVRRDNEQLLDSINTLHSQLRSQDLHTSSSSSSVSDRGPPYVRLRNLYEAAVRLADREEEALLSCLERIDEIVSSTSTEFSSATIPSDAAATTDSMTMKRESHHHHHHQQHPHFSVPSSTAAAAAATIAATTMGASTTSAGTASAPIYQSPTTTKMAAPAAPSTTVTPKGRPSSSSSSAAAAVVSTTPTVAATSGAPPLKKRAKTEHVSPAVAAPTTTSASTSASYEYLYPEESRSIAKGREVAAKVSGTKENGFWILAAVIKYFPDKNRYEVEDVDDAETRKRYLLPAKCVVALPDKLPQHQLPKGSHVIAMFPDTTTFYPAIVEVPPNKQKKKNKDDYSLVFEDDEIPFRFINFKFVVQIPN